MATQLTPQQIRNIGVYGVIREAEVDYGLAPEGSVPDAVNFHFDRKGAATVRPGMTTLGATIAAGYPIWGLHNAQNGTMFAAISQSGTMRLYALPSGGAWASSLTAGTANTKIRLLEAAGRTVVLNWGNASNMYSSIQFLNTSGSWVTTGNPINPQALTDDVANSVQPQFGEVYKSRIYLAGGDTSGTPIRLSRLHFSEVINSSGNYTWSPSTNFVDINPNDGENISALKRFSLELLVFKPNYIYRFKTAGVDPDPLIKIGTRSQESVVEGKRGLYFHHDTGFYRYTGGFPTEISRPISDIVDAIPFGQYDDISAWKDSDHIYWSLGTVAASETGGTLTIKNAVARYTESSDVWTLYAQGQHIRLGTDYNSSTALSRVVGLQNGVVATYNSGTTDLGEPIPYRVRTKYYEFEGLATRKVIQELVAYCEKAQGAQLMYRTDEDRTFKPVGQLTNLSTHFDKVSLRNHRIQFQVTGLSRGEPPIFRGIDIIKGLNEGIVDDI